MVDFVRQYWLQTIFGGIVFILSCFGRYIWSRFKKELKKEKASIDDLKKENVLIKNGLVALTHDRLFQMCKFHIDRGMITVDELKNVGQLYESYHSLGGNGTGTNLYNKVCELKITQ